MSTIAEKLQSILDSKAAIKQAIIDKGVECGDTLSEYADHIASIPTSSGKWVVPEGLKFVGSLLHYDSTVESLDFSQVKDATDLFTGCSQLYSGNFTFDLPAATNIIRAFSSISADDPGVVLNVTVPALYDDSSYEEVFLSTYCDKINFTLTKKENPQDLRSTFTDCMVRTINLYCESNKIQKFSSTFTGCSSLTNLHMETQIVADLDLSDCVNLTVESLVGVIAKLVSGMNKTLTLGATNLAKLTDEQKAVATAKGWTLA